MPIKEAQLERNMTYLLVLRQSCVHSFVLKLDMHIEIMYILRVTTNEVHRLLHTEEGFVEGFLHTAALGALEA